MHYERTRHQDRPFAIAAVIAVAAFVVAQIVNYRYHDGYGYGYGYGFGHGQGYRFERSGEVGSC